MLLSHVLKFNLCVQFMLYVVQPHINGINFACCSRRFGPRTWYFNSERCSGSFGCFLFITSSRPASPSPTSSRSHVPTSPRPHVPTSPRPHVPSPHVPASPSPTSPRPRVPASHVPVSPRPTSRRPRVLASQVPRPRPTFSHSRIWKPCDIKSEQLPSELQNIKSAFNFRSYVLRFF